MASVTADHSRIFPIQLQTVTPNCQIGMHVLGCAQMYHVVSWRVMIEIRSGYENRSRCWGTTAKGVRGHGVRHTLYHALIQLLAMASF